MLRPAASEAACQLEMPPAVLWGLIERELAMQADDTSEHGP
jgi:hypothetical protein